MNILDNEVYIFTLQEVINNNQEIICGFTDFFHLLIELKKKVYIINRNTQNELNINNLYILNSNIVPFDNDSYMKIVKENIEFYDLYEIIIFESSYKSWLKAKNIIYNCVFVNNSFSDFYDIIPENTICDFKNIKNFVYKKSFEYIPFYISSKTKHRNKWIELKKYFPIKSTWIQQNKNKNELTCIDKKNLCDNIQKDISESSFGIFYCEKNEEFHIGSLIEIGLLLAQSKKIFICGEDLYNDEVLFKFKCLFNFEYTKNYNLYKTFKKIQYDMNPNYIIFKENIKKLLQV